MENIMIELDDFLLQTDDDKLSYRFIIKMHLMNFYAHVSLHKYIREDRRKESNDGQYRR